MNDIVNNYSLYEVTITELATGKQKQVCLTNSKEKAKLFGIKKMCENYSFIMFELRRVEVVEHIIQTNSFSEYWMSQLIDHRDIELQCLKLLHNAKCTDRIQNQYKILCSNVLLKI